MVYAFWVGKPCFFQQRHGAWTWTFFYNVPFHRFGALTQSRQNCGTGVTDRGTCGGRYIISRCSEFDVRVCGEFKLWDFFLVFFLNLRWFSAWSERGTHCLAWYFKILQLRYYFNILMLVSFNHLLLTYKRIACVHRGLLELIGVRRAVFCFWRDKGVDIGEHFPRVSVSWVLRTARPSYG